MNALVFASWESTVSDSFGRTAGRSKVAADDKSPVLRFGPAHRHGQRPSLVVSFESSAMGAWVGEFLPGSTGFSQILPHPDGRTVIVVSCGLAYQVDPQRASILGTFGGAIESAVADTSTGQLSLAANSRLWLIDQRGISWRSPPVAQDNDCENESFQSGCDGY